MVRVRFKEILVLLPLLLVWITFQISHYNKRIKKLNETNDYDFDFRSLNSTDGRWRGIYQTPVANKLSWMPPNLFYTNYDDDFHGFLKPEDKNIQHPLPGKLWFMTGGNVRPEQIKKLQNELWPEQNKGDRIVEQLMYSPRNHSNEWSVPSPLAKIKLYDSHRSILKKILLIGDFVQDQIPPGRSIFWQNKCPVNTCAFVSALQEVRKTDAVIFKGKYLRGIDLFVRRRPDQVWILYLLDPTINEELGSLKHVINWTASYRHDSDIVTPYGKFVPYDTTSLYETEEINITKANNKNYAANKTKKVAWVVSNCDSRNERLQYARNLSLFIEVDIYGSCGNKKCNYSLPKKCLELLPKDYKFYLSFENHYCKEYITEKFFEHGLGYDMLPIVMGPPREDYERIAPPHSFIHVDDFATPEELADYLNILDANDTLYNAYFSWKSKGELINTHFWCRLCALLHSPREHKSYEDIQKWWSSGPGVCET